MFVRKFRCVPGLLLLPALFLAAGRPRETHSVFDQIDSIVKVLSDISGLTELHPVPYGRLTKNQLRKFLIRRIKNTPARRDPSRRVGLETVRVGS